VDDITKMFNVNEEIDEPTGYTSKKLVSGRSWVFAIAVLHLLLDTAAALDGHRVAAWVESLELFTGKRAPPTTKDMINGRGGTVMRVEARLVKPPKLAVILSNTLGATFSSQGKEKLRVAVDMTTTDLETLLNTTDTSMSNNEAGRSETDT
jgi:hypothetical protein